MIKQILRENAGISFTARVWTPIIMSEIANSIKMKEKEVVFDGTKYPEQFEQFPVDFFVLDLGHYTYEYLEDTSGYDKDGNYVVHMRIPNGVPGASIMNHEMKHAYQDYMRQSGGGTKISQSKEIQQLYTPDFVEFITSGKGWNNLKSLMTMYYNASKFEDTAYLENIYDDSGIGQQYEYTIRSILDKDFSDYKRYGRDFEKLKELDIPLVNMFHTLEEFVDYSEKYLKNRADKIVKKINKMKYAHDKIKPEVDDDYGYGDTYGREGDGGYDDDYQDDQVYDDIYELVTNYMDANPHLDGNGVYHELKYDEGLYQLADIYNMNDTTIAWVMFGVIEDVLHEK